MLFLGPAQTKKKKKSFIVWLLTVAGNKKLTQNCSLFYEIFFFHKKQEFCDHISLFFQKQFSNNNEFFC